MPDGKTLRFALSQPVKLHVSQIGNRAVVDLATADFAGTMPDLVAPASPKPVVKPVDVASLPEIKLRAGSYAKFTRLVFDWPRDVSYQVFPGAGKMTVRFAAPARADVSAIARFAPPWVKNAAWRIEGQSTIVEFETDSDSGYHDFKDGTHVVLDVLAPKTDAASYAPPGIAKPSITAMTAAQKSGRKPGPGPGDRAGIAATGGRSPPPKPADSKPAPMPRRRRAKRGRQAGEPAKRSRRLAPPVQTAATPARRPQIPVARCKAHPRRRRHHLQGRGHLAGSRLRSRPDRLGGAGKCARFRFRQSETGVGRFRRRP